MARSRIADQALGDLRADSLLRIAAAIETAVTLDELLMLGLHEFARLLELVNSGVILLSDDGAQARLVSTSPPRPSLPPPFALAETTVLQQVVAERQPAQLDVARDLARPDAAPATLRLLPYLSAERVESLLLIPLVAQDSCIGVLVFASVDKPRRFSAVEVAHARLLAGQLAAAITSFRITEKAQRRTEELATLNDIAAAVASSLDTREVYHLVMEKINKYFRVDAGSLLMLDEESGELVFVMTLEAGEEKLFGVRVPRGQGIVWSVADAQRYAIVNDAPNDPRFYRQVSDSVGYEVKTILCVPILVKGRTIGVIELLNKRDGPFGEEEAGRLMRMAATIGVAIENARLFQTVTTVRDRLEAILNSTNDGILMADMRDVVVTANPEAARLLQVRRDDLISRPLDDLLAELRARATDVSAPSWLNDGDDGDDVVVELELASPQRRYLRHYTLPVRETSGAQIGRLALFQDISKERELAQLREDYTGMLVHDLRAPLTAIMNGIMMVKRGLGGPISDQQQELLGIAHQGSQTMLEMINTLLDIARLEQGHMSLNCEPLSPYAVVDQTLDRLKVAAEAQRVRLAQELTVGLPLLEADREKLVRVLQNLLDNAIKFSPGGSVITLGASFAHGDRDAVGRLGADLSPPDLVAGDWLVFWVRDQGPGIPPQYHERIFEKFGQVHGGRKVRGTGLGLTFCKLAVEAHGGRIWLQSAQGVGSTFALALPLSQDQRP
ncbi:MAG TPA: GAF domain-containing sensor histidine kinase [Chloroflexaceae bacterium]|nr:GAF domain-containing sensor histidine kinase [Chloroflexaceae bacterium]